MTLNVAAVLNGTGAAVTVIQPDGSTHTTPLALPELQRAFEEVAVDSRAVVRNSLFVALRGERVDGHDYAGAAVHAGALGALVERLPDVTEIQLATRARQEPAFLFVVPDPLESLQRLASYWRDRHDATIVGITGSIGKTTTKEIVAGMLSSHRAVLKSLGNLNSEVGLPLMLLQLRPEHRLGVLEMGMYVSGDISLLATIARPGIGVVTAIGPNHLERMGSIEAIAREKSRLVAALPTDGLAVLNADDPWTRAMARASGNARPVLVGLDPDAEYRADDVAVRGLDGTSFTICAEGQRLPVETAVAGVHTVHAFLAGAAIARFLGMSWSEIEAAIETVRLDARQRIIRHRPDVLIIDDSYNAAPMSMHAALALLDAASGTKIAVLGDMLELGPQEEAAHREVGRRAAQVADWLVACGSRSGWMAEAARQEGLPAERAIHVADNREALDAVRDIVTIGPDVPTDGRTEWTILVKGSRSMEMEYVVNGLRGQA